MLLKGFVDAVGGVVPAKLEVALAGRVAGGAKILIIAALEVKLICPEAGFLADLEHGKFGFLIIGNKFVGDLIKDRFPVLKIGRASCRERV